VRFGSASAVTSLIDGNFVDVLDTIGLDANFVEVLDTLGLHSSICYVT
jgi:hypothetical protein